MTEEEELTKVHKNQIDSEMDILKEEMKLIVDVQKPNSDIWLYVDNLQTVLMQKLEMINALKYRVEEFACQLDEEEKLANQFKEMQKEEREKHYWDDDED